MNYISICSGIEAASVAWHPLGWEPLAFSEIEPFPCAVLAHHWPHVPNLGDMTKHENWTIDIRPDLIVGGTPCQAFSVAGLRKGLADPRGNLTLTFLSILAQYRPRWVVWENVPGVLSENTGAFGALLGGLGELGYGFAYRVLDAQYFGVAQRRRRVFVVAHLGDWRPAAAVLFERESLRGDSPPSREAGQETTAHAGAGTTEPIFLDRASFNQGENAQFNPVIRQDGVSDALVARGPHAVAARMVAFGEYVADETASTMKMRDHKDATDLVVTTIGIDEEQNAAEELMGCLKARTAGGGFEAAVCQYGEIAGSLTARHDSSPCADRGQNVVCAPINTQMGLRGADTSNTTREGIGIGNIGDPAFTLQAAHSHAIATPFAVRRLTPRECERLQGFPDDHTFIPFRGKPAADGPRYKACGNSMAVPVMRWIGERIQMVTNQIDNQS
jgi:DNA (cytosine-5)-methyltransferase 1